MEKIKVAGVYKIINIKKSRFYIGSAKNLSIRKNQHFKSLKNNLHFNKFLQNDFNICGFDNFRFVIVETTDYVEKLVSMEQKYLDKYFIDKNCYNICPVAYSRLGTKHTIETKEKMSKAWTKNRKDDLVKRSRAMGLYSAHGEKNPFYGKKHTEETKNKISKANTGRKHTVEEIEKYKRTIKKIYGGSPNKGRSKTQKEKYMDMMAQKTRKKIIAINITTNEEKYFESIRHCSRFLNLPARHQINIILNDPIRKNKTLRTYKNWRFEYGKN